MTLNGLFVVMYFHECLYLRVTSHLDTMLLCKQVLVLSAVRVLPLCFAWPTPNCCNYECEMCKNEMGTYWVACDYHLVMSYF